MLFLEKVIFDVIDIFDRRRIINQWHFPAYLHPAVKGHWRNWSDWKRSSGKSEGCKLINIFVLTKINLWLDPSFRFWPMHSQLSLPNPCCKSLVSMRYLHCSCIYILYIFYTLWTIFSLNFHQSLIESAIWSNKRWTRSTGQRWFSASQKLSSNWKIWSWRRTRCRNRFKSPFYSSHSLFFKVVKMKTINEHLCSQVNIHEEKLCGITDELNNTWWDKLTETQIKERCKETQINTDVKKHR